MKIQDLQALVTSDLLNSMLAESPLNNVQIQLLESRPAKFPFLEDGASNNALFLELNVSTQPPRSLPERMVLKAANNIGGTAEREVTFYEMTAASGGVPGVVKCYCQKVLSDHDLGLMLLELIDADAIAYDGPDEEHLEHYCEALRILASLHASWWDDPALGSLELSPQWTKELLDSVIPLAEAGLQALIEVNDSAVRPDDQTLVRRVLSRASSLMVARSKLAPLCVTHGDAALWNFVMDRNEPAHTTLVDLQMWSVNPPVWDLAYMVYLLWPTDFRRKHGGAMVKTYLSALAEKGLIYTSEDLERDLRLSIIGLIVQVLAYYRVGIWRESECQDRISWLLVSFDELEGDEFLQEEGSWSLEISPP